MIKKIAITLALAAQFVFILFLVFYIGGNVIDLNMWWGIPLFITITILFTASFLGIFMGCFVVWGEFD